MRIRYLAAGAAVAAFANLAFADEVVTDAGDNGGANQLRAKLSALQSSGGGKLTFNVGFATVVLQQGVLPNITTNCTIDGGDNVTISGNDKSPVFYIDVSGTLTLSHLIVSHAANSSDGGAIQNSGALTIDSCKFTNNQAGINFSGGVILNLGKLTITNSEFASNSAGNGGVLFPRFSTSSTTISGSSFHDNTTTNQANGWGGVMLIWDGAQVSVDHCTFGKNAALYGGAFYLLGGSGGTMLTLTTSTATANTATQGGAVYVTVGSSLAATDTTFNVNSVGGFGGDIATPNGCPSSPPTNGQTGAGGGVYNSGTSTFTRCTFDGNVAVGGTGGHGGNGVVNDNCRAFDGAMGGTGGGGAVYNTAVLTLTNCTVSGNRATGGQGGGAGFDIHGDQYSGGRGGTGVGGGVYNAGTLTLGNCTIAGNSAVVGTGGSGASGQGGASGEAEGGGIFQAAGSNNLRNDLISSNTAFTGGPDLFGPFTSQGYNLVRITDNSTGFTQGVNHDFAGTGSAPFEPHLDPNGLQDNGGLTKTIALLSTSPAIDAGTSNGAPITDQRGFPRAGTPDIGAFEFGSAAPTPTPSPTPQPTASPTPTPSATPTPASQLLNLSTRKQVGAGDNVLIGGFIVAGTEDKKILLRGLGPELPVNGPLADPTLELHAADTSLLAFDDNWRDKQPDEINATGIPPANDLESAVVTTLPAKPLAQGGAGYTGVLGGNGGTTGIGLLEIYDLNTSSDSTLANISTRGFVGTGDDLLIGGFIPGPSDHAPMKVLVRALGPSLTNQGVTGALQDPQLELHDPNGTLLTNDNWKDAGNAAEIQATLAPPDDRESAIITTLAPSNSGYTAVVRGVNGSTGVALVEVYALQ